jgi:type I restriction enzyme S subunit
MEMTKYKLGDIAKTGSGGTPKSTVAEYYENGNIPWINSGELNNPFISTTSNFITQKGYDNSSAKLFPPQTVLLAMYGATAGKASLLEFEACTNQAICAIMPNQDILLPRFLKYKLDTMYNYLVGLSTGSARDNLSQDGIKALELCIPPLSEQKKIASVLSELDDKIALNKKMNQKLERMAKRLYDYWFVQYDFPDKNGHPYKTTGGPMTYNPTLKREIPEGWEVKSLFDCSDVLYGFPYATEPFDEENLDTSTKPYPVIRIRDIKDNSISAKTTETVDDKYRTKVNDLLIGMDGYFHMSFWPRNDDYVNQRITRIRQKELSVMIIYHQIAPFIKFKENQAKGSTVGHLSDKDMKQINILVPNNLRLSEKFDGILNLITKNKQEITRLTKLRDKLLPLLMNGQVEMK